MDQIEKPTLLRDNTHRTLRNLVGINAWFVQDAEKPNRFTLHADVSFSEERLGGDSPTQVIFRMSVRRCDIIFRPPAAAAFRIDSATVRSPRPLPLKHVSQRDHVATKAAGRGKLTLPWRGSAAEAELSHERTRETTTTSEQTVGPFREQWRRVDGYNAWSVDGKNLENGRLAGSVFDAHKEPRLTLIDGRSENARRNDEQKNMQPVAGISVRCLREDIDIYDIRFKDPDRQKLLETSKHKAEKLLAAREVLKEALLREGLSAGNLTSDPFAEMSICDVAITIADSGA